MKVILNMKSGCPGMKVSDIRVRGDVFPSWFSNDDIVRPRWILYFSL